MKRHSVGSNNGIVALPLMLLISGIVLEITIAISLIIFYLLQSGTGARSSSEALSTARSGIDDAAIRIARDKSFGYAAAGAYQFSIDGQHTATVTVCNESHKTSACGGAQTCDISLRNTTDKGKVEITVIGTVRGKNRCIRGMYEINADTGELKLGSLGEISL